MSECAICGGNVNVPEDVEQHEILDCVECGAELEVMEINPLQLAEAPEEEEDWGE